MADRDDDTPVDASLDELLAKKPADTALDEDDDTAGFPADTPVDDGTVDPLTVRAVPQQANEFTCRNCFLVKHRSQLADAKRILCADCS